MKIQLETGETLEVDDNATPAQIDEVIAHYMASKVAPQPQQPAPQESTFLGRTLANAKRREAIIAENNRKPVSSFEKVVYNMGQAGMMIGDTLGDAVVSGASYLTPDVIEKPVVGAVGDAVKTVADSGVGQFAKQGADVVGAGWEKLRENYPRVVDFVEGGTGMALGLAPFTNTGRGVVKNVAEKAAEVAMSPLTVTLDLKDIVKGITTKSPETIKSELVNLRNELNRFINATKAANIRANKAKSNSIVDNVYKEIYENPAYRGVKGERADLYKKVTDEFERFFDSAANAGGELSIPDIDASRAQLNRIWAESLDAQGKPSPEGTLALRVSRLLRSEVEQLKATDVIGDKQQVKNSLMAAKAYSQLSKAEEMTEMILKADGDPKKLKRLMTNFYLREENLVGYTKKEIAAVKKAKKSSKFEDIISGIASAAPDIKNPRGAVFATAMLAGPLVLSGMNPLVAGAAVATGSTLARAAYVPLVTQRAKNVIETINKSNPLVGK